MILSFDPGCRYSAYSLLVPPKLNPKNEIRLAYYGLVRSGQPKASTWDFHAREITRKFSMILRNSMPDVFLLEFPTFQSGTKGYFAAREGSTLKLAALCGMLINQYDMYALAIKKQKMIEPPLLVPPYTWKGQIPKNITQARVNVDFNLELKPGIEENISDAIGLGHWYVKQKGLVFNVKLKKPERKDF